MGAPNAKCGANAIIMAAIFIGAPWKGKADCGLILGPLATEMWHRVDS